MMSSLVTLMEKYSKFAEKSLDQLLLKDDTGGAASTTSTTTRPTPATARSAQPSDTTTTSAISLCFISATEIHPRSVIFVVVVDVELVVIVKFSEFSSKFFLKFKTKKRWKIIRRKTSKSSS